MLPPPTPVTVPSLPTVAIDGLVVLHVPPANASLRVMPEPTQNGVLPVNGGGTAFTDNVVVAVQVLSIW